MARTVRTVTVSMQRFVCDRCKLVEELVAGVGAPRGWTRQSFVRSSMDERSKCGETSPTKAMDLCVACTSYVVQTATSNDAEHNHEEMRSVIAEIRDVLAINQEWSAGTVGLIERVILDAIEAGVIRG